MSRTISKTAATATKNRPKVKISALSTGVLLFVLALLIALIPVQPANARSFPQCDDTWVEARILRDFNWAERQTWQRGISLARLERMHEHRVESFENSIVTRRYCMANAEFSDGSKRSIYYMINDHGGFVGLTWKVTHCVLGLDPWRNHDGNCRAIR